ncbi:hypothetical protein H2248_000244 [Termitomyces sp. 'cryptogamus']|nr:hypothetical protein H2248_000244 [Termitomyces sp. 'cryptogamus']
MSLAAFELEERGDADLLLSPSSTLCSTSPVVAGLDILALPRLEIASLDTSPFSNSFHGLIEEDSDLLNWRQGPEANDQDISYDIERYSNMKELVPGWDDDDVDEILVMCPKTERKLTTIEEEESRVQSMSLADFEPLPHHLRAANGDPLYRNHETGRLYVLKGFPKRNNKPTSEMNVLEILMDIKASFLPRIYCSFGKEDFLYMAMEYYSRETMKEIISSEGALKPERARFFACEILQALTVLHAAGIIHRDLRPENIIIDNAGHLIVEGFESSEILPYSNKSRDPTFCTTPIERHSAFSAPELLLGWSHDYLVDTWGFGMLLLFMISGRCILDDSDISPVGWKKMIIHSPIVLPLLLETVAHDLISKCLERNPTTRLSLLLIKKHNYFSAVDWKKVAAKRIRVPWPLHMVVDESRSQFRDRLDRMVSSIPRTRSRRFRKSSHVKSSEDGVKIPENSSTLPCGVESLQAPHSVTSMSSFDDLHSRTEPVTSQYDPALYNVFTLNDTPLKFNLTSQDLVTSFWESLDSEQVLASSGNPDPPDLLRRPRKLRKCRSSIYPEHRVSALSTLSLQNLSKLRKFGRSTSTLPQPSPILDLPEGIQQIGGGIGFKYEIPAAARSRDSICTNTPQTCHGFFNGRLHGLGIGLWRSPTVIAKAKAKRALKRLVISAGEDDPQAFPTAFRGSNWSLVMPASQKSRVEATSTETAANSPVSEPVLMTTMTLDCAKVDVASATDVNLESADNEVRVSELMTLRLVL